MERKRELDLPISLIRRTRSNVKTSWVEEPVSPRIHETSYVDPMAVVIGDVTIGEHVNIAPGATIRADEGMPIVIGNESNIQDGVIIHSLKEQGVKIGERVSLAHGAIIHGPVTIGDGTFIGFGSVVYQCNIGSDCVILHNTVVTGNVTIPNGKFIAIGSLIQDDTAVEALPNVPEESAVMEINMKKAEAELAGELQKHITSQEVKREEVLVEVAEKKTQIDVAEQEILRKQKELEATIEKQAEADKYQIEKQAEAEKFKAETIGLGEAEAIGTAGFAEAEAERIKGIAEAEVIKATGEAEAEAMMKKAEAWQSYNKAAITEILIEKLPEIAKAVAEPLAKTEKIIMISGSSGAGVSKITSGATNILAQLPPILEGLSGVSVKELIGKISGVKTMEEAAAEDVEVDIGVATEDVEVDLEEAKEESG